jgi:hypothetical protein
MNFVLATPYNLTVSAFYLGDSFYSPSRAANSVLFIEAATPTINIDIEPIKQFGAQNVIVRYSLNAGDIAPLGTILVSSRNSIDQCRDDAADPSGVCLLPFEHAGDYVVVVEFTSSTPDLRSTYSSTTVSIPCQVAEDCGELSKCSHIECSPSTSKCSIAPRCYDGIACTDDICDEATGDCSYPYHSCSRLVIGCSIWVCSELDSNDEESGSCIEISRPNLNNNNNNNRTFATSDSDGECAISQAATFTVFSNLEQRGRITATQAIGEISAILTGLVSGVVPLRGNAANIYVAAANALFDVYSRESSPSYLTLAVTANCLSLLARIQDQIPKRNALMILDMAVAVSATITTFNEPYDTSPQALLDLIDMAGVTLTSTPSHANHITNHQPLVGSP